MERRRILGMLAEGKISLDECEKMLSALPQESKVETKPPVKKKSSGGLITCLIMALVGGVVFVLLVVLVFWLLAAPASAPTQRDIDVYEAPAISIAPATPKLDTSSPAPSVTWSTDSSAKPTESLELENTEGQPNE